MERYPFLRFAGSVLRVVGWIVLVLGIIGSIGLMLLGVVGGGARNVLLSIGGAVATMIGSYLVWVFLLAAREVFYLLIHMEENIRKTAERVTQELD